MWLFILMAIVSIIVLFYILFGITDNKEKFNEYIHDDVKIGKVDKVKKLDGYAYSVFVTLEKDNTQINTTISWARGSVAKKPKEGDIIKVIKTEDGDYINDYNIFNKVNLIAPIIGLVISLMGMLANCILLLANLSILFL